MADKQLWQVTPVAIDVKNDDGVIIGGQTAGTRYAPLTLIANFVHNLWAAFINAITPIKTSFANGDKFPVVNGSTATAMEASTLLELTAQNARIPVTPALSKAEFAMVGADNTAVTTEWLYALKGSSYKVTLPSTTWAVTNVGATATRFQIQMIDASGNITALVQYLRDATIPSTDIEVTIPDNAVAIRLFARADVGTTLNIGVGIAKVCTFKDQNIKRKLYIADHGNLYFEGSKTLGGKVWIKAVGGNWASRLGVSFDYSNSAFATYLGVSLESSAKGITDCIPIASGYCLVATNSSYVVEDRASVTPNDVVLLYNQNGRIAACNLEIFGNLLQYVLSYSEGLEPQIKAIQTSLQTMTTKYSYSLTGNGNTSVTSSDFNVIRGAKYRFTISPNSWPVTQVTSAGSNKFIIVVKKIDGTTRNGVNYTRDSAVPSVIDFIVPNDAVSLYLFIRADTGNTISVSVELLSVITERDKNHVRQLYPDALQDVYVEESYTSVGKIWFRTYGAVWVSRLAGNNFEKSNSTMATYLGVELEESPSGIKNCIPLADTYCFVATTGGEYAIKSRSDLKPEDIVILSNVGGRLNSYSTEILGSINRTWLGYYKPDKVEDFCNLINGAKGEKFLFFTDPHILVGTDNYIFNVEKLRNILIKLISCANVDFVCSGGDWLTAGDTQLAAIRNLGYMNSKMQSLPCKFISLLGNHDTNYQGVVSADDPSNGILSQDTINLVMFSKYGGKAYYKFDGAETRFFVLDSGVDSGKMTTITDYEKSQLVWLAGELAANDKPHVGILVHIITNDLIANVGNNFNLTVFAGDFVDILSAFNARTSVTKYDNTYDFSGATGYAEFVLAGHSHAEANKAVNGIPIVLRKNFYNYENEDLVLVDYNSNKMSFTHIGTGNDLTVDVYSGTIQ